MGTSLALVLNFRDCENPFSRPQIMRFKRDYLLTMSARRQAQHRPWPLYPSWSRRVITVFPRGSAWLDRLQTDPKTRLRFLYRLHNIYMYPFMQLSSDNRVRANILADHIAELEGMIADEDGRNHRNITQRRLETGSQRARRRRQEMVEANLTKENLALIDVDPRPAYDKLPRMAHYGPPTPYVNKHHRRSPSKTAYPSARQSSSKTPRQEPKEIPQQSNQARQRRQQDTFNVKCREQIDTEAGQSKKRPQPEEITRNDGHPERRSDYRILRIRNDAHSRPSHDSASYVVYGRDRYYPHNVRTTRVPADSVYNSAPSRQGSMSMASRQAMLGYPRYR